MHLKISPAKWRPFWPGGDELNKQYSTEVGRSTTRRFYLLLVGSSFRSDKAHDDVIKWKHFPRYWPFVRGIHRSPVNSPHKGQWRGALMFYLICAWINVWVNIREAGDLRRHRAHYDVIVMYMGKSKAAVAVGQPCQYGQNQLCVSNASVGFNLTHRGRNWYFADGIFSCIFMIGNWCILIQVLWES